MDKKDELVHQINLFDVEAAYTSIDKPISNKDLYQKLSSQCGIPADQFEEKHSVGEANAAPVSLLKRRIRWYQQTLKHAGILEKTDQRGFWKLRASRGVELRENIGAVSLVTFSTDLGVAIWSRCEHAFSKMDEPITLCVTSPPYPLKVARAYGNPTEPEYVDFICRGLEPIVKNIASDGSICLNISNDIFEHKSPARSLYKERLVLALNERFGLQKMDELIWENRQKLPSPIAWASKSRQQLNVTWEPILWLSPSPVNCKSNNKRVLLPHTEAHKKYMQKTHKPASYSDGAYRRRANSYKPTPGKIPRNLISMGHNCTSQSEYKKLAKLHNLPVHGAPYPLALVKFLIEFMTEEGDLVVDPFAGSGTTGLAAEITGRRWLMTDNMLEYLLGSAYRFCGRPGWQMNNQLSLSV